MQIYPLVFLKSLYLNSDTPRLNCGESLYIMIDLDVSP